MKIPYDSLCMAVVIAEIQPHVGSKVQNCSQPTATELSIGLYGPSGEAALMLSCHPEFARMHFSTRRLRNAPEPPSFLQAVRAQLDGSRLVSCRQIGFDRIAVLSFEGPKGKRSLIAEIMGKHSNLILVDESGRIVSAAKIVGESKSKRPVLPGRPYLPPPFEPRPSLLEAKPGDELSVYEGASPFLLKWISAYGEGALQKIRERAQLAGKAYYVPQSGAYPLPLSALGLEALERESLSIALEQHFSWLIPNRLLRLGKASLLGQLNRVLSARRAACDDLKKNLQAGEGADALQRLGELILAYGPSAPDGISVLDAWDYEGNPISIPVDPELSFKENADRYFKKARRFKNGRALQTEQLERLSEEADAVAAAVDRVESIERLSELENERQTALKQRWLSESLPPGEKKSDEKPYGGKKVRHLFGPDGIHVLYGENAEANDYLTTRIAKPNDWWLHIRGAVSAHVVIQTNNKPERVNRDQLLWAARVAVMNSPSKHSGLVSVDYTLRKYVRKPRGSATGFAVYTHEKTLDVVNL